MGTKVSYKNEKWNEKDMQKMIPKLGAQKGDKRPSWCYSSRPRSIKVWRPEAVAPEVAALALAGSCNHGEACSAAT